MLKLKNYRGKKIGILGLGLSGKALFEALKKAGADIVLWDDRLENGAYQAYIAHPEHPKWHDIEQLIISPGIQHRGAFAHPVVSKLNKSCEIFCDIELFYRSLTATNKTIAITGTNGKSTTTALIAHILEFCGIDVQMAGNIGVPVSSINIVEHESYVLELSSYQLDKLCDAHFNISVLTNITPDHLEMHGNMTNYTNAKMRIFDKQTQSDYGIVCVDNRVCVEISMRLTEQNFIAVSKERILDLGVSLVKGIIYDHYFQNQAIEFHQPIALSGSHNSENIICAIAATLAFGLKLEAILDAIYCFEPLAHRLEYLGNKGGVSFVNDSKGTNFDSTRHALAAYQNIHWIAGGKAKEGGIEGFEEYVGHIKAAYLIGSSESAFAQTIGTSIPYIKCGTLERAFNLAVANATEGDVILLSPASASTDQWKNFEERGEAFRLFFNLL
jgi:UDP-N-acetylmuramoylalanine--D-glutamate ligase